MDSEFLIYLSIGISLFVVIFVSFSQTPADDSWKKDVIKKINETDQYIKENNYNLAIIEADKTLDFALKKSSFQGKSMGERLKNAKKYYEKDFYNIVWEAHKIRNALVHEIDYKLEKKVALYHHSNLIQAIRKLI